MLLMVQPVDAIVSKLSPLGRSVAMRQTTALYVAFGVLARGLEVCTAGKQINR